MTTLKRVLVLTLIAIAVACLFNGIFYLIFTFLRGKF